MANLQAEELRRKNTRNHSSLSTGGVYDIQWMHMNKAKYYPLTVINMFTIRSVLYPLALVRTRLQVQRGRSLYTGTINAMQTIVKYEGMRALYKGFSMHSLQIGPVVMHIISYELIRQEVSLLTDNMYIKACIGGAGAGVISQTISVPLDIFSQHMQLAGQVSSSKVAGNVKAKIGEIERIVIPRAVRESSLPQIVKFLSNEIYKNEGPKGFYRGFFLSTLLISTTSALWWPFYYFYQGTLLLKIYYLKFYLI